MNAHGRRSGIRVVYLTLTTLHLPASNPAAITCDHSQNYLLVKIPEILDPLGNPRLAGPAVFIRQTAVVLLSFIKFCNLADSRLRADGGWLRARVHNSGEIWQSSLLPKFLVPCEHGCSLRLRLPKLGLHASHHDGAEQLFGRNRVSLNFAKSLAEDLCDVQLATTLPSSLQTSCMQNA